MFQTRTNRRIRNILWLPDGQLGLVHEDSVRVCWLSPGSGKLKTVRTFESKLRNCPFIYREGKLHRVSNSLNTQLVRVDIVETVWCREYSAVQCVEGNNELVRRSFPADEDYNWTCELYPHGDTCLFVETNKSNGCRRVRDVLTNKVVAEYQIPIPPYDNCWTWKVNLFTGEDGSLFSYDIDDLHIWKNGERERVTPQYNCGRPWNHPFISRTGGLFIHLEHCNFTPYYEHQNGGWRHIANLPIQATGRSQSLTSDAYGRLYFARYNQVRVYDPARQTHLHAFSFGDNLFNPRLSVSPDSTRLAAWDGMNLVVLDIE